VDLAAAVAMPDHHGWTAGGEMAVAPLEQCDEHRSQIGPPPSEPVLVPRGALLVADAAQDPLFDQPLEPRLKHVARDPQIALELLEAVAAEEHVAQDQQGPALADQLERAGDR